MHPEYALVVNFQKNYDITTNTVILFTNTLYREIRLEIEKNVSVDIYMFLFAKSMQIIVFGNLYTNVCQYGNNLADFKVDYLVCFSLRACHTRPNF